MTSTLVVGGSRSGKSRHAEALLSQHERATYVATRTRPTAAEDADLSARIQRHRARRPRTWTTIETRDLTKALLSARNPVLVDSIVDWLWGQLDDHGLWDDQSRAAEHVDALLDELRVAILALPFDIVIVTQEPTWNPSPNDPRERLIFELLAHANQRLSAACTQVHAVVVGRVLDLSQAPVVGR